jgi:hypothetical protein
MYLIEYGHSNLESFEILEIKNYCCRKDIANPITISTQPELDRRVEQQVKPQINKKLARLRNGRRVVVPLNKKKTFDYINNQEAKSENENEELETIKDSIDLALQDIENCSERIIVKKDRDLEMIFGELGEHDRGAPERYNCGATYTIVKKPRTYECL